MDKILRFNTDRCTGCGLCELICSLGHVKACNPERSRIRILRMEEKGVNIQMFCQQCEDAVCIAACPVSAINKNQSSGMVEIDYELCIKCKECLTACPYKGIYFDNTDDKIIKCDLCGGNPKCVTFCETKAIQFMEKDSNTIHARRMALQEIEKALKLIAKSFS